MKKFKKGDNVTVIGRRWFEKTNGNTYHSVQVYINGDFYKGVGFDYGYGNAYAQTAIALIRQEYKVPEDVHAIWQLKDHGVKVIDSVTDVSRKKDLEIPAFT